MESRPLGVLPNHPASAAESGPAPGLRLAGPSCGRLRANAGRAAQFIANASRCAAQKNFVAVFESPRLRYIKQSVLLQRVAMISRFLFYRKTREFIGIYRIFQYFIEIPGASRAARPRARKIKTDQGGRVDPGRREKGRRPNRAGRSPPIGGGPPLSFFRVPRVHENVSSSLLAGDSAAPRPGAITANARKCGVEATPKRVCRDRPPCLSEVATFPCEAVCICSLLRHRTRLMNEGSTESICGCG